MSTCNCTMRERLVGDGCYICNPAKALEYTRENLAEAEQQRDKLLDGWNAACAFIDSHAADPDITSEMVSTYAEFMRHRKEIEATK